MGWVMGKMSAAFVGSGHSRAAPGRKRVFMPLSLSLWRMVRERVCVGLVPCGLRRLSVVHDLLERRKWRYTTPLANSNSSMYRRWQQGNVIT